VSKGCSQFGGLSPLQWRLIVNVLLARLNEEGVYSQGYANEICLLAVGKLKNTLSELIQWTLHTVEAWCDELGLSVNPDKTGLVAFTRRRKLPGFLTSSILGNLTSPHVGHVTGSGPGFTADLEGTRGR
jgi:hypothetical protein